MAQSEEFIFPGWEVTRKLGEGSFGGVYEIRRTLPGGRVEKCALKRLTVPRDSEEIRELYAQSFSKDSITAHYKGRMEELVNEYGLAGISYWTVNQLYRPGLEVLTGTYSVEKIV